MAAKGKLYLERLLPADFFSRIADGEYRLDYYPAFSDRRKWSKARKLEAADRLIGEADRCRMIFTARDRI